MSRVFSFGVGLTASDDASGAIHGVIESLTSLEDKIKEIHSLGPLMGGVGGEGLDNSLASSMGGAIVDTSGFEESQALTQQIAGDLRLAVNQLDNMLDGMEFIAQVGVDIRDNLTQLPAEVDETTEALVRAEVESQRMNTALVQARGSVFALRGGFDRLLGSVASLSEAILSGIGSELEHSAVRLTARFGEGRDSVDRFNESVLATAGRNAVATEAVTALAVALGATGARFEDMAQVDQDAFAHLTDTFGMGADAAAQLAAGLRATGGSLQDTLSDAVMFEKNFGVPGLLEQLPETIEAVIDAQSQFSSLSKTSAASITKDIQRMTGVYAKALGKTGPEAAQLARASFMKFAGEVESFEDVFLGLSDDFSPLQKAFLETGIGLEDMEGLMRKATQSPAEFASEVLAMRDSMDPQMGERFMRQVMRNVDEGTAKLLTQREALANASEAERKVIEAEMAQEAEKQKQAAAFGTLVDDMRKNAVDAANMFQNLLGVFKDTFKVDASEVVRMGFEKLISVAKTGLDVFNDLRAFVSGRGGMSDGFKEVASTAVAVGAGFGTVLPIISRLFTPLRAVGSAIGSFIGPVGSFLKGILGAGEGFGFFGGSLKVVGAIFKRVAVPIGIAIAAFEGVKTAVSDVGAVLSDPSKTGWEKFQGVIGGVLSGVWTAVNTFFLGIPDMIVEGFQRMGQSVDTTGTQTVGEAVGRFIGNMASKLVDFAKLIPGVVGGWITSMKDAWNSGETGDMFFRILGAFSAVGQHLIAAAKGVAIGLLDAFGIDFNVVWDEMAAGAERGVMATQEFFYGLWDSLQRGWVKTTAFFELGWAGFKGMVMVGVGTIKDGFYGLTDGLQVAWTSLVGGMETAFLGFVETSISSLRQLLLQLASVADTMDPSGAMGRALQSANDTMLQAELSASRAKRESADATKAGLAGIQAAADARGSFADAAALTAATEIGGIVAERDSKLKAIDDGARYRQGEGSPLVGEPPITAAPTATATDVADRAEGPGGSGMSEAQFSALLAALTSMQNNPAMAGARQGVEVTLRHAAAGNTHFERALAEGLNATVEPSR